MRIPVFSRLPMTHVPRKRQGDGQTRIVRIRPPLQFNRRPDRLRSTSNAADDVTEARSSRQTKQVRRTQPNRPVFAVYRHNHPVVQRVDISQTGLAAEQLPDLVANLFRSLRPSPMPPTALATGARI